MSSDMPAAARKREIQPNATRRYPQQNCKGVTCAAGRLIMATAAASQQKQRPPARKPARDRSCKRGRFPRNPTASSAPAEKNKNCTKLFSQTVLNANGPFET